MSEGLEHQMMVLMVALGLMSSETSTRAIYNTTHCGYRCSGVARQRPIGQSLVDRLQLPSEGYFSSLCTSTFRNESLLNLGGSCKAVDVKKIRRLELPMRKTVVKK